MVTRKTVFVTGGTGFLGSFLVDFLLRRDYHVVALVRGPEAEGRLLDALREINGAADTGFLESGCLTVVEGDVRLPGFGLPAETLNGLVDSVEEIWHGAASLKFQERYCDEIAAHNIAGTQHILEFARRCNRLRSTPMFHVSTAYAGPFSDGLVREVLPATETPFRNRYEWSKQEAERLVGTFRRHYELPVFIVRPAIIIGHSRTGRAVRFSGYYDVFRALYLLRQGLEINLGKNFDRNLHLRIRASVDVQVNVVPVDFVVEAMWRLAQSDKGNAWIFNITNERPPSLDFLFTQACSLLSVTGIELVDSASFAQQEMSGLERIFNRKTQFQAPYLLDGPAFDNSNFRALVPETLLPCPPADETLMRRINEYYYYSVLDQQFGVEQKPVFTSPLETTTPNVFAESHFRATA